MPVAKFELDDGRIARFEVPEGTTPEQAQEMAQPHIANLMQPPSASQVAEASRSAPEGPKLEPSFPGDSKDVDPNSLRGRILSALGGASGGIVGETKGQALGGAIGAAVTKSPTGARVGQVIGGVAGSALGSAVGGGGASLAEDSLRALESTSDNITLADSVQKALDVGGEEAVLDLALNTFFRGGAATLKKIGFKPSAGAKELQETLKTEGSTLALDQAVDNSLVKSIGELLRGSSLSGGRFDKLDIEQGNFILRMSKDFAGDIAKVGKESLTAPAYARLIKSTIRDAGTLHGEAAGAMFRQLDDLPKSVQRNVKKDVVTPVRSGITSTPSTKVVDDIADVKPVDLFEVRKRAADQIPELKRLGLLDANSEGAGLLQSFAAGDAKLTFSETHTLLSNLKRVQRSGKFAGDPAGLKLGELIGDVDKAFHKAGSELGGEANKVYKQARNFWKFGKNRFGNDFIEKLAVTDPTALGKQMAKETPENLLRIKGALKAAEKVGGAKFAKTWGNLKGGVITELMPQGSLADITVSPISKLKTDRDLRRRLDIVLDKPERQALEKSISLMEDVLLDQKRRGNLTARELGAIGAVGVGTATGFLPPAVATFIAAPAAMAQAMTRPTFVDALVKFDRSPAGSQKYRVAVSKLLEEVHAIQTE